MIPVIDLGSRYTRLLCRKIRELGVNSRIYSPGSDVLSGRSDIHGIILSGSPASGSAKDSPSLHKSIFKSSLPVLGICSGMQVMVGELGGEIQKTGKGQYSTASLEIKERSPLFKDVSSGIPVRMSGGGRVSKLPGKFKITAGTPDLPAAAIENTEKKLYGLQFPPEAAHTRGGEQILKNFLFEICGAPEDWSLEGWIEDTIGDIRKKAGNGKVIMALSGGVDSSVTCALVSRAMEEKFFSIFVDHGLMRKKDIERIQDVFIKKMGIKVKSVDSSERFFRKLEGVSDPEEKRKIIGKEFIEVFTEEAKKTPAVTHLGQGTIFPDIIESAADGKGGAKVKSHHNVGGLPEQLGLELIEPLELLYKDEVRQIGLKLGLPGELIKQHPFPGPGLAVRILGPVDRKSADILREADQILDEELKKENIYYSLWQAFCVLLPVKTVGISGEARTYENALALRCVKSEDAMTARWADLPHDVLERISTRMVKEVKEINRVVYDITNKPPGTIEWE